MASKNEYIPQSVTHPGVTLGSKIQELHISVKDFAIRIGMAEECVMAIINGKKDITNETAIALENATNIPSCFWTERQRKYNESISSQKLDHRLTSCTQLSNNLRS